MDLTQDISYRGFLLNDADIRSNIIGGGGAASGISGCVIDSADFSDLDVVQFLEKRSQGDGMDAGDVFLGARRIRMAGTLYNTSRAALYDDLADLRAALAPVLAQRDEPLDRGYRPMTFSWPTLRTDDYPSGQIDLQLLALPRSFQQMFDRDQLGGDSTDALAIPWQATFICRDPGIKAAEAQDYDLTDSLTGNTVNRGTYLAPVNMVFVVTSAANDINVAVGDSLFYISVPASTGNRIFRVKEDKVLTVEEDSVEVTRLDLLDFSAENTWPLISPGTAAFTVSVSGDALLSGSHFWFYEQYA